MYNRYIIRIVYTPFYIPKKYPDSEYKVVETRYFRLMGILMSVSSASSFVSQDHTNAKYNSGVPRPCSAALKKRDSTPSRIWSFIASGSSSPLIFSPCFSFFSELSLRGVASLSVMKRSNWLWGKASKHCFMLNTFGVNLILCS